MGISTKGRAALKLSGLVTAVVVASLLARQYGLVELLQEHERLHAIVHQYGVWAPLVYSALRTVLVGLALPMAPLTMATGFLFAPLPAVVINLVTTLLAAVIAFYISRGAGRQAVQALLGERMAKLDRNIGKEGIWVMIVMRLAPIFPFNAISYWAGLTSISARDFAIGTVLGILPHIAIYTYLGVAIAEFSLVKMSLAIGGLLLLSGLAAAYRRQTRSEAQATVVSAD